MYRTMNRFKVIPGAEAAFGTIWKSRDSQLLQVPGFVSFHLMKGAVMPEHTLYASHTLWASEADFAARTIFEAFRSAHVLAFCHKTPESPRCLIESLISATPIVGYEGAFARDLISGHGGGIMVPGQDPVRLARELAALAADRARLGELIARAAQDGAPFSDEAVFHHRSEVIRANLPRG